MLRGDFYSRHMRLIIGFLRRVYLEPVVRQVPASALAILLGDELHAINQLSGETTFPKQPSEYLNDWAEKDWLRKFYTPNSDEPYFDVTSAAESAVRCACDLGERTLHRYGIPAFHIRCASQANGGG